MNEDRVLDRSQVARILARQISARDPFQSLSSAIVLSLDLPFKSTSGNQALVD